MKPVFYMSYSIDPENDGLVFPSELPDDIYSPGIWIVERGQLESLNDVFAFDAVDKGELQTVKLQRINRQLFYTVTKYGKFFFWVRLIYFRYRKYVGKSELFTADSVLYQVVSTSPQSLHLVCLEQNFFFVGRADERLG